MLFLSSTKKILSQFFYEEVRKDKKLDQWQTEIVFINDGSIDKTEEVLAGLAKSDNLVIYQSFTRNFGKEAALFAGLECATGDIITPIDVDLQDPLDVIPKMIEKWQKGG